MPRQRIIPVLLLSGGRLVKTVRFRDLRYVGDPINAVRIFNEKEVDELIILDITATIESRRPQLDLIENIASECFMPLCYGGGVRTLEEMREIFALGVEKIVINTYAVDNPSFVAKGAEAFGSQSIVVAIDVRKSDCGRYRVVTHAGSRLRELEPIEYARLVQDLGAGEVLLNSVDRDGTMIGYDLGLIESVSAAVTIPVIACGGAGKVADLAAGFHAGAAAAAAGSVFVFRGRHRAVLISYPTVEQFRRLT